MLKGTKTTRNDMQQMEKEVDTEFNNVIKSLSYQSKALNKQTKALTDNMLGKECKSTIFKRLEMADSEVKKIKETLYSEENSRPGLTKQFETFKVKLDGIPIMINKLFDENKKEIINLLSPITTSIEAIESRNSKKDAINAWKNKIPNALISVITTISTIIATYFLFK